ncbi:MAG TPA: M6 family metalloprotease domain-containing protein, partial [Desulfitobacteriaceae bacterium]|nr:M6 family metalloprotease domain-containing protein [Desulfitobacteriaceae bacterium]
DKTNPHLVWQARQNIKKLNLEASGITNEEINKQLKVNTPPPAKQGLPTKGSPKVLAILIDFPDYPHNEAVQTVSDFSTKFTGDGDLSLYPYDSITRYYERSSYNQLSISSNILGWYRAQYPRSHYEEMGIGSGEDWLIKEAINYYDSQGHDFSQYDNNNDGVIDGIYIKWTGPNNGWANFWWAYQCNFCDPIYTVDGKHLNKYVWSWYGADTYSNTNWTGPYEPRIDIHETGHLLGLPDYYDYDRNQGPCGGLGGLDMMDSNWGDHNCFSKFMLDWITPTVISSGSQIKDFNPSGTSDDAALIMKNTDGNIFNQYFMVQYRKRSSGNDPSDYPTDGMLIWHVDATLNELGNDFLYDNSYTSHKLLALEQADGLNEIEQLLNVNSGDYYVSNNTFGLTTNPNSNDYNNTSTDISVDSFTTPGTTMGAKISIGYNVSGRVTTKAGLLGDVQGISGVTINFIKVSGSGTNIPSAILTDENGNWFQTGCEGNTVYRVIPMKQGYTFTPEYLTFSDTTTTLDFTGATANGCDLKVLSVSAPESGAAGSTISISDSIQNSGNKAATGFYVKYYLSADENIGTSDVLLGQRYVSSLAAGAANSATKAVVLPATVTSGTYYVGAIADATNLVPESDENNNSGYDPVALSIF